MLKLCQLFGDSMKKIVLNDVEYELIKDERDCFSLEEVKNLFTDYFDDYDYVVGDYSYSKLRLKGFYDAKNKKVKDLNNYNYLDKYLETQCAYNCKYFVIKRNQK